MLSRIREIKAVWSTVKPSIQTSNQTSNLIIKTNVIHRGVIQPFNPDKSRFLEPRSLLQERGLFQTTNFYKELEELCTRCSSLQLAGQHHAVCELLEEFFNKAPLPSSLSGSLSDDYLGLDTPIELLIFLKNLKDVQTLYFISSASLVGTNIVLPNQVLFKLNVFSILAHINSNQHKFAAFINEIVPKIKHILKEAENTSFLANYHPGLDIRLAQIRSLFREEH